MSLSFAAKHTLWTSFPASVTLGSFQTMGRPQMTHFIGGSILCLGEETSSGIEGDVGTIKHSSCVVTTIPILFAFRNECLKRRNLIHSVFEWWNRRNLDFESNADATHLEQLPQRLHRIDSGAWDGDAKDLFTRFNASTAKTRSK